MPNEMLSCGGINVEGMFNYMTKVYYNNLTKKEKESFNYEYYKKNKNESWQIAEYYNICQRLRRKKNKK